MTASIFRLLCLSFLLLTGWVGAEEGADPSGLSNMKVFRNGGAIYLHRGGLRLDQRAGVMVSKGPVYAYDEKGVLRSVLNFDEQERRSGVQLAFSESGAVVRIETWRDGILDGDWMDFDTATGAVAEYRKYSDGKQVGSSTIFDTLGKPKPGKTEEERAAVPRF